MQRGSAVHILQMQIGPVIEEALNGFDLPLRIPGRASDEPICCIMKRAASAPVPRRVGIGPRGDQQTHNLNTIAGCGQMQQRIAHVYPIKDTPTIQLRLAKESGCEPGIRLEQPLRGACVIRHDCCNHLLH
jgi:hypothetical protein